jgi:uncharacterized protein YbgA (DUF1722 family)/uncharacterized protein YbbK (DUF523 family)
MKDNITHVDCKTLNEKIKLGISACLLGEKVRYDGTHQHDRFLTDTLGKYVEYVPVCPEVECGMPIPREALRLVGVPESPRLVTRKTHIDHTDQMLGWAAKRLAELEKEDLCGFIFKSRSPSSGMERVKVYSDKGMPVQKGVGVFARVFMKHFPLLPVEEDGRLHDLKIRENFIERIFSLKRWRKILKCQKDAPGLIDFHTRHKLLILSHSQDYHEKMGTLVGHQKECDAQKLFEQYEFLLMKALNLKTTTRKNLNVLYHLMGYFKKELSADEKQELLEIFQKYRDGHIPLIVPVTLINHFVRKYRQSYLAQQVYLNPHPIELQLRNHV